MSFVISFKLPKEHNFARAINHATRKDEQEINYVADGKLVSSLFKCDVGGRAYTTQMVATMDEKTGRFDVALSLQQTWSLRDVFNGKNRAQLYPAGSNLAVEQAVAILKDFEQGCEARHLPVKEGRLVIIEHYANLGEVQDRRVVPAAPFRDVKDVIDTFKPR